jgi:two-component system sensor histidine kinase AlgZ
MHPILARPTRVAAYLAIWAPFALLLAALLALQGLFGWTDSAIVAVPLAIAYSFLCLSAWYVAGGSPVDRAGGVRVAVTAALASFMSSAVWLLAARGWLQFVGQLRGWPSAVRAFRLAAPTLFGFGFLLYLLAMAASYVAAAFAASREAERRGLSLQVFAREAELRALRAQIDPHFLFNSLQSISALTTADPAAARRMCLMLADFLRDTLSLGARDRIPLASELALARRFLAIEQMRFGDRLRVDIASDDGNGCEVPPLILQPLIENAVTHGVAHMLEGGTVAIRATRHAAALSISVENPCDADRPAGHGTGVGLRNVKDRLRTLYETDASIRIDEHDGRFIATVELPLTP